jgi:hypothetical protein
VPACASGVTEIAVVLGLQDGLERWASCFGGLTVVASARLFTLA